MTRKDFELIAAVLRKARLEGPACISRVNLAADMADALRNSNDRFDYTRFMEAATVLDLPKSRAERPLTDFERGLVAFGHANEAELRARKDCSNTLTGGQCFEHG